MQGVFSIDLLKENCLEYFLCSIDQITTKPHNKKTNYKDILNKEGLKIYEKICEKIKKKEFKDEISIKEIYTHQSGTWCADEESPFYNKNDNKMILNTYNNCSFIGVLKEKEIITSTILMYNIDENWCFTISGSLYKLVK